MSHEEIRKGVRKGVARWGRSAVKMREDDDVLAPNGEHAPELTTICLGRKEKEVRVTSVRHEWCRPVVWTLRN